MKEQGNALFLILIAVALFAALSYAVTQSGRSGGGVDKEKTTILAAELVQQAGAIRTRVQRIYLTGEASTFLFDESAYNSGADSVGIFNIAEGGIPAPIPSAEIYDTSLGAMTNLFGWNMVDSRLKVNGVDEGTSARDQFLRLSDVDPAVCAEINNKLYGDPIVPAYTMVFGSLTVSRALRDGTYTSGVGLEEYDMPLSPGCVRKAGIYYYIEILKSN